MMGCWTCGDAALVNAAAPLLKIEADRPPKNLSSKGAGSVRVVNITGLLTPFGLIDFIRGGMGTAVADLIDTVRKLAADSTVGAVVFLIDSPGGSSTLMPEAADEIRALSAVKPTISIVAGGYLCSGAYLLASATGMIFATRGSIVGSIGTYIVAVDSSNLHEKIGLQVHVIRSTPLKGLGIPGEPISDPYRAELQRFVDSINRDFLDVVSVGRNLKGDRLAAVATGQFWRGQELVKLGLVDAIVPNEAAAFKAAGWDGGAHSLMAETPKGAVPNSDHVPRTKDPFRGRVSNIL